MTDGPPLPIEIASGILIAVAIVWLFRIGVNHYQRGEFSYAFLTMVNVALFGGGIILAGIGLVDW